MGRRKRLKEIEKLKPLLRTPIKSRQLLRSH